MALASAAMRASPLPSSVAGSAHSSASSRRRSSTVEAGAFADDQGGPHSESIPDSRAARVCGISCTRAVAKPRWRPPRGRGIPAGQRDFAGQATAPLARGHPGGLLGGAAFGATTRWPGPGRRPRWPSAARSAPRHHAAPPLRRVTSISNVCSNTTPTLLAAPRQVSTLTASGTCDWWPAMATHARLRVRIE